jgi:hypothetical protein
MERAVAGPCKIGGVGANRSESCRTSREMVTGVTFCYSKAVWKRAVPRG